MAARMRIIAFLLVGMALGATGYWYWRTKVAPDRLAQDRLASTPAPPAIAAEAKAYVRQLGLSGIELKATEAYSGQTVVEILGRISNNGDRALQYVEVTCVFYDPSNRVVLRERVPIVKASGGSLKPGESRPFRLPFDNLPQSWNQALPQLVIAQIRFA